VVDVFSAEKRSKIMAAVAGKNTKPEIVVRRLLHGLGYRYRLHAEDLPGKPDLYFAGRRKAVLVNGCFWHGHSGCTRAALPTSNAAFWQAKIARNVARDAVNVKRLKDLGIESFLVWQCELRDLKSLERRLSKFLGKRTSGKKT
jgi:DNA mismatch endonuclease (patch repair protein)